MTKLEKYLSRELLPNEAPFFWLTLIFLTVANTFLNIGSMPLMDVDEGAFTEATREMFVRNDFLATYLNGEPRHDKPILFYWFQALSIAVFGLNEWGMRFPSVVFGLAWSASVWWFCKQIECSKTVSLLAALMILTSLHLTVIVKVATADALLNLWLALSMFHLMLYLHRKQPAALRYAAFFAGLGFVTKGPVAVVIPGGMVALYCLTRGNYKLLARLCSDFSSWAIFIAVAIPWYVAVTLADGGAFLHGFLFNHNLNRFNTELQGHSGPIYYYLPVLLLALLPYSPLLVRLLGDWRTVWHNPLQRMMALWFLFVLVLFSLSTTKLPHYLIYGYSGLIVLLSMQIEKTRYPRWIFVAALILALVFLVFPHAVTRFGPDIGDPYLRALLLQGVTFFSSSYYLVLVIVILIVGYFCIAKADKFPEKLAVTGLLISFTVSAYLMPGVIFAYQTPVIEAARIVKERPEKVVFWRLHMPSFSVYREQMTTSEEPAPGIIVLTKAKFAAELPNYEKLYQSHGLLLAKILDQAN